MPHYAFPKVPRSTPGGMGKYSCPCVARRKDTGESTRPCHPQARTRVWKNCVVLTSLLAMAVKRPFTREQRMTIVHGILCFVLILVVLQLWLFTATMNAFLGGDEAVIWPAAAASIVCLLLNAGLLWYLYTLEGRRR